MIPRNFSRHIILALCLGFIALGFAIPARTENAPVAQGANHIYTKAFCSSEQDKPVVYFSKIFDVDITVPTVDTQPLVNGFIIHLKEKYDYQTSSNYPVVCPLYKTPGEAEATRRKMQVEVQQTAKQIIEVDWDTPRLGATIAVPGWTRLLFPSRHRSPPTHSAQWATKARCTSAPCSTRLAR